MPQRAAGQRWDSSRTEVSGGKVLRLAADFDQTCLFTNPTAPLHGSIRFNSSLPIRR